MATVRELVTDAFLEAGILAQGESVSAEDGAFGLRKLNRLLDSWSADGLLVFKTVQESLSISASGVTIGVGSTLNTQAPIQIVNAGIVVNGVESPVDVIGPKEYAEIQSKSQTGRPSKLYHEGRGEGSLLYFWPVPDQTYTLKLFSQKKIVSFTSLNDTVSLPPGYERLIVSNLAVDLCGQAYGVSATGEMIKAAQDSLAACARSAFVPVISVSDLASLGDYNINSRGTV